MPRDHKQVSITTFECDLAGCAVKQEVRGQVYEMPPRWVQHRLGVFHSVEHLVEALAIEIVSAMGPGTTAAYIELTLGGPQWGATQSQRFDSHWVPGPLSTVKG